MKIYKQPAKSLSLVGDKLSLVWLTVFMVLEIPGAYAQSYLSPGYLFGEVRDALGIVTAPRPPEFVVRGRPEHSTLDYVPLKPPPRGFHSQSMTPAGRLQAEAGAVAELEGARAQNQARAAETSVSKSGKNTKVLPPPEEDPSPMQWNAWDTE